MAARNKQLHHLARQLFRLSFDAGSISAERVSGVLAYIERHRPAHPVRLLKAYHRLIATELGKHQAVIEYAGAVSDATVQAIAAAMAQRYNRPISPAPRKNDALLAGLRVRVGDDVFESSISSQLAALAAAV